MNHAKSLSFVVPYLPATEEGSFLLETSDGRVFEMKIPEHVAAGQRVKASVEEDSVMLEFFHEEGAVGLPSGGDNPKVVIGTLTRGDESSGGLKVYAQMDKKITFIAPAAEVCMVALDDGREFEVNIPEHIAAGQHIVAAVTSQDMLVDYYHSEGEVGASSGEGSQLVVGSQIKLGTSDVAEKVRASTVH
jgi:hypothetical protein